jgi:uncharacterized protein YbaP (TraB family)
MSRILAFFCLLLGLAALAPQARAEPAMWSVTDADSTLYLFGTFHALPPDLDWTSPKIKQAFAGSDELWLEAVGDDPAAVQKLVAELGHDPRNPLPRKLSVLERRQLGAALKALGLPIDALRATRPWFAALQLSLSTALQIGLTPEAGADKVLEEAARQMKKPVRGFETMEQQLRFFADMPPELELDLLRQTLAEFDKGAAYLNEILVAWRTGDTGTLDATVNGSIKEQSPALYDIIIVQRNADWLSQIEQLMAGAGTHFIAVGAGHLVGDHALPAALAAKGFTVTRQ